MSDNSTSGKEREVVEETINAYHVQKLSDGSVRIKSGGCVSGGSTYFEALESYASWQQREVDDSPEHLREEHRESIYDGYVPLYSFNSSGFTPDEILDAVTIQPLEIVLDDLGRYTDTGTEQ